MSAITTNNIARANVASVGFLQLTGIYSCHGVAIDLSLPYKRLDELAIRHVPSRVSDELVQQSLRLIRPIPELCGASIGEVDALGKSSLF